ncbi:MAG TPA: prolyl oligopeptidase family serine peptidase [Candidatus Acidoferrales bacterium]|jgi:dienelactone hydrolase|nr:prolyl oligopeptidase family serine peptidase [Candidatus Acidoferrales bacterium]
MRRYKSVVLLALSFVLLLGTAPFRAASQDMPASQDKPANQSTPANAAPRPIDFTDAAAWKGVNAASLSDHGDWFAYRLSPQEGDSSVVIRQTSGTKEYKFPIGEVIAGGGGAPGGPGAGAGPAAALAISIDSKYAAFTMYPTHTEATQLKKQKKPLQSKVGIVNLATGEKIEITKIRRFAFSGENGAWIAMQRYGPDAPAGAPAAPPAGPPAGGPNAARDDRPKGSDLLLRELATGQEINIGNVSEFAFDKHGNYFAWTTDAQDKAGNGVSIRNNSDGTTRSIESDDTAVYSHLTWTEDGDGLAVLKGVDDKGFEDKLYSVVGFKEFGPGGPQKTVFKPADFTDFPAGMTVSPDHAPMWTKDLGGVLFGIHKVKKKEHPEGDKPDAAAPPASTDPLPEDKVDLVVWNWQDKRLQSQQQVQEPQDKSFSYLCEYRVGEKKFIRLADDEVRDVTPARGEKFAIGMGTDPYELMGNLDGRHYFDVYAFNLQTGERKLAVKKARWFAGTSPTGTHFVYHDDGNYFTYDMATGQAANITKSVPTSFVDTENDTNVAKPPTAFFGWSKDGKYLFLSDNWDIWQVAVDGSSAINLTVNGKKEKVRYRRPAILNADQHGYDLTKPLYIDVYGEWTKKDGIGIVQPGKPGVTRVMWDDAFYSPVTKARQADVFLYTRQTYKDPPDYYVTDASIASGKRITDLAAANGQDKFPWSSGTILVDYTSEKGDKLQGALHLPANYEKGKTYPTIVYFYEKTSQNAYQYSRPIVPGTGFNAAVYTSNGYAVFNPDITYKLNDPGMSAVWCMRPAVKAAIVTGVVDPKRVGIHGHSWGGYQTAFIITQTDMFAAAVAGAPLTDMISMYAIIYKNSGSVNGEIFESSQGRFTSGPWENWAAYTRNSPVAQAANVKTPLIILSNDKDGAVDFTQGMEYYNTLRRLQKPVVLLEYPGENHGLAKLPNQKDYAVRMKEFFDHFLMGKPAPDWYANGVPRLDMEDHLKSRQPVKTTPPAKSNQSTGGVPPGN